VPSIDGYSVVISSQKLS